MKYRILQGYDSIGQKVWFVQKKVTVLWVISWWEYMSKDDGRDWFFYSPEAAESWVKDIKDEGHLIVDDCRIHGYY